MDIFEDKNFYGFNGQSDMCKAVGIAKNISKFKFIVAVIVWHKLLFEST